jgi:hypothetical protein
MVERTSTVTVRTATPDDEEAVFELSSSMAVSFPIERAAFERTFSDVTASPEIHLLVAVRTVTVLVRSTMSPCPSSLRGFTL